MELADRTIASLGSPRPSSLRNVVSLFLIAAQIGIAALAVVGPSSAFAEDRTFRNPRWGDNRLDVCLSWGRDCGQPAAVAFCNRKKYADVANFGTERVGNSAPTQLFMSDTVCHGDFCTAFTYITCTNHYPNERVFVNPAWDGYRLDACREWGQNCGKPAADAFCIAKGFSRSRHEYLDADRGYSATKIISSGQVCDQPFCVGFQMIICE